jgi:hypothetical protein
LPRRNLKLVEDDDCDLSPLRFCEVLFSLVGWRMNIATPTRGWEGGEGDIMAVAVWLFFSQEIAEDMAVSEDPISRKSYAPIYRD